MRGRSLLLPGRRRFPLPLVPQRARAPRPSALAERVLLTIMRDASADPDLRLSAAHVAIVLEHMTPDVVADLDKRAVRAVVRRIHG
jgi:hypothetical protein